MSGHEGHDNELIFNSDSSEIYIILLEGSIHRYKLLERSFSNIHQN